MKQGYWMLVLHAHLPFVKHPDYDYFLEENWLFEAITETYLPILLNLKKLEAENVHFRLTSSVTPPLAEMLADYNLRDKYIKYLDRSIELVGKELWRTKDDPHFKPVVEMYRDRLNTLKGFLINDLDGCVLNGYKYFQDKGYLEIITCGATHGYLPFMTNEKAVRAQLEVAARTHEKHFGRRPLGIWLPECAYYSGLEYKLEEAGIKYFFVDTHGILYSKPRPRYGTYAPVYTKNGVAAFGRDYFSSKQVWSSKEGYPGDLYYRDFYRDIGYDLDYEYIKPYICPDGTRVFTGLKYHRITGDSEYKEVYQPDIAYSKTIDHAKHFVQGREAQINEVGDIIDRKPLIISPYDSELYGHWWFEGPDFLMNVFREMDKSNTVKAVTALEYLGEFPTNQVVDVNPSSWGDEGYYKVWLNAGNDWIYRHLHFMADNMTILANKYKDGTDTLKTRCLNQLARELLLCQASDWAFLITTGTATEYSTERTREHIYNFMKLYGMLEDSRIDIGYLEWLESKNSIFQGIDYRIYA